MQAVVRPLRQRVDPTGATALVAVGDLACIAGFVLAGELAHGVDPIAEFPVVAETYAQFLLGWVVVAVPIGLYAATARSSIRRAATLTAPAWIGAALLAQGIRATPLVHGNAAVTFFLVSVAVGLALLVPWRVAVAARATRRF